MALKTIFRLLWLPCRFSHGWMYTTHARKQTEDIVVRLRAPNVALEEALKAIGGSPGTFRPRPLGI